MHRNEAIKRLKQLEGRNLYELAKEYDATVLSYELVRECLNDPRRGFSALTGKMGEYLFVFRK